MVKVPQRKEVNKRYRTCLSPGSNSPRSYSTLALKLKPKSHLTNQHMGKSIWSLAILPSQPYIQDLG